MKRAALPLALLATGLVVSACTSGSAPGHASFSVPELPTLSTVPTSTPSASPSATRSSSPVHRAAPSPSSSDRTGAVTTGVRVGPTYRAIGVTLIRTTTGSFRRECTATVVDSTTGDVVVTAAHCGSAAHRGSEFAPDYDAGRTPYGIWSVTGAYTSKAWHYGRDPAADYMFLRVRPIAGTGATGPVQQAVGGVRLGVAPAPGTRVTVIGYTAADHGRARTCVAAVTYQGAYPLVHCAGYGSGTSGSPFLAGFDARTGAGTLVGLIGGPHGGGCDEDSSLSAPFGYGVSGVLAEAEAGGPSSPAPTGGVGEGC